MQAKIRFDYFFLLEYFQINTNIVKEANELIALNTTICHDHKCHPYIIQQIPQMAHIQNINEDNHFTSLLFIVRKICGRDGMATHSHAITQIISKNMSIYIILKDKPAQRL